MKIRDRPHGPLRFCRLVGSPRSVEDPPDSGILLFADEVFTAADLNRRSSEILNHARENPVTINRNSEQFALLRRDQAARLVRTADRFGPTIELIGGAISAVEGNEPPASLIWLKAVDADDLRKMTLEVIVACAGALDGSGDWEKVDTVMHEWHESALVALSGVLRESMESDADESPLVDPRSVPGDVETETEEGRSKRTA